MSTNYQVEHRTGGTELRGVLRLESVAAYDQVLGPARAALAQKDAHYLLDLRAVSLMNSSGVRALANLVLWAKQSQASLLLLGSEAVAWQRKTMASLAALYDRLQIELR